MNSQPDNPMNKHIHLVQAALDLRQGKEFAQAAALLQQAIQVEPDYIPAYIFLGLVCQDQDKLTEAETAFRQALFHDPENPEALQCLGMLYLKQERVPEAIANLEKHLQLEPENATSLDVLAPLLVQADRSQDAETFLRAAWQKTQDNRAAVRFARFLISQEKLDLACQFLNKALQINENANLFVELALVFVIQKSYAEAIQALEKALALRPDYDRALRGLAHCYTQMDQADKAIEYAERALAIDPRHYRNWQAKADSLLVAARYDDALSASLTGIRLINPADPEAQPVLVVLYLQRVNAYLAKKDIDSALAELFQARKVLPKEDVFYMRAIELCIHQGCVDDAIAVVEEALNSELPSAEKWIGLGYQIFIQNGQYERLLVYEKEKSVQYSKSLEILIGTGVATYTKGQADRAQILFEKLLQQFPDDLRLRTNLSYILIGEGQLERARMHLKTVLATVPDPDSESFQSIALCNLGYLDLLEGRVDEAQIQLMRIIDSVPAKDEAILRVAFWWNNQLVPDYAPHPSRSLPLRAAAYANLVTAALMRADIKDAQRWTSHLREEYPDNPVVGEILSTIYRASGDLMHAQEALQIALGQVENPQERQMLEEWFSSLR